MEVRFDYSAPQDGPTLDEVRQMAKDHLMLDLGGFITRAIILYYEEVSRQVSNPEFMAQFQGGSPPASTEEWGNDERGPAGEQVRLQPP